MADSIYYNGVIHTMAGKTARALAVRQGKIAAVGQDEEILSMAGNRTVLVNLEGRCLLPGFHDSHCHLLHTGVSRRRLDLTGAKSPEEIVERGRAYIARHQIPKGEWVVGRGFDHNLFPRPVLPDGKVAQAISQEHPVFLDRVCGHVGAANTLAFTLAGITEDTQVEGGSLDRDEKGRLTGVLRETAMELIFQALPPMSEEAVEECLEEAAAYFNTYGITSVQSDDTGTAPLPVLRAAAGRLAAQGRLGVRIYEEVQAPRLPDLQELLNGGWKAGQGDAFFRVGNIKLLTDGSLGARTALLREDYRDEPGNRGIGVYGKEELAELLTLAHCAGLQTALHAIGDRALELCVEGLEQAQRADPTKALRHRIVHCQIGDLGLYRRMKELGICADIQPAFTASDYNLVAPRVGKELESTSYNWRTLLEMGIPLGGGSDSPVETPDPLWGIACAVNRTDERGLPLGGWLPGQRLTVREAVELYTTGSAYLAFEEEKKGRLLPGMLADFVVLNRDIFQAEPEELRTLCVEMTVTGGLVRYEKGRRR